MKIINSYIVCKSDGFGGHQLIRVDQLSSNQYIEYNSHGEPIDIIEETLFNVYKDYYKSIFIK